MKVFRLTLAFFSPILFQLPIQSQTIPDPASAAGPVTQLQSSPCGRDAGAQVTWDLVYPGASAQYVGGTVPDMQMTRTSSWLKLGLSAAQFRREGHLALSSDCLLFAFDRKEGDHFRDNANYHVVACGDQVDFSKGHDLCTIVAESAAKSYLMMIPYAKVNTLSRAKYASSDLTASVAAAAGFGSAILTAIASSVHRVAAKEQALGGATLLMTGFYYFAVAKPHMEDNYIASFIELPVPQLNLSRMSNLVHVTTATPNYVRAGQQVQIAGVANTNLTDIAEISRDRDGKVTVRVKDARRLPALGSQVQIVHLQDPSLEGQFQVASVTSAFTFTVEQKGKSDPVSLQNLGQVQDVWNGTFTVESVESLTTFTYEQAGVDDSTRTTGSVGAADASATQMSISGNVARNQPGAATARGVDVSGTLTVNPPPGKADDLFKRGDLVIFRIPNFHDYYNISMILSGGTGLTFVNETTDKAGK